MPNQTHIYVHSHVYKFQKINCSVTKSIDPILDNKVPVPVLEPTKRLKSIVHLNFVVTI